MAYMKRGRKANEWQKARRKLIKEALAEGRLSFVNDTLMGLCEDCRQWKPLTPDHITKRSQGGEHTPENIEWVCSSCHNIRDNMAESKKKKGKKTKWELAHPCVSCHAITRQYLCHICGQPSIKED